MQKPVLDKNAMIKWLGDVIEAEIKKPDNEIDTALIVECSEYLDELLSDIQISDEQMKRNIAKIKNRSCDTTNTASTCRARRTPRVRRFIAAICAAILILGCTVSAYAFIPAFRDMIRDVLNLPSGSCIEGDGVTFTNRGQTREYESMDELIREERLGILYPHNLPDGLKIKFVSSSGEGEDLVYFISFVDNLASITIRVVEIDVNELSEESQIFTNTKNITSYTLTDDDMFTSVVPYNGFTYYITTHDRWHLTEILENLY